MNGVLYQLILCIGLWIWDLNVIKMESALQMTRKLYVGCGSNCFLWKLMLIAFVMWVVCLKYHLLEECASLEVSSNFHL